MGEENRCRLYRTISFAAASAAALLWMWMSERLYQAQLQAQTVPAISHIVRYVVCLLLFTAAFFCCNALLKKRGFVWKDGYTRHLIAMLIPVGALVFAIACMPFVKTMLGTEYEHYVGFRVKCIVAASAILTVAAWHLLQKRPLRAMNPQWAKILFAVGIVLAVAAVAWTSYTPNSMRITSDYEAYWFSTFSLVRGIPVDEITASFYGHYGMLQAPFFWLLGGFTPYTCAALTALEAGVVMLAMCYVISCVTKRFWLRFLGVGMLLFRLLKQTTLYAQGYPHRYLFQALLLAFGAWFLKRVDARDHRFFVCGLAGGYALAAMGAIWSNDTGMTGLIAWGVLHGYCLMTRRTQPKKVPWQIAQAVVATAAALAGAWGITSALNILVWKGDAISFQLFLYPLLETVRDKMFEGGALPLVAPWVPAFLLLLYDAAQGMANLPLARAVPQKRFDLDLVFFSAVMGLGALVYFFNRATYGNFYIGYLPLVVCMLVAVERFCARQAPCGATAVQQLVTSLKQGAGLVLLVIPVCLCAAMVAELPTNVVETRCNQTMAGVEQMKVQITSQFPQGTAVYGWDATYYNALFNPPTENIIWVPGNNVPWEYPDEILRRRQQAAGAVAMSRECWENNEVFGKIDADEWANRYQDAQTVEGYYNNEILAQQSKPVIFYAFSPKKNGSDSVR
ncbi:MAG: hypothetical protein RSG59_07430 [Ruthenibacterium sp.]